jgi:hypothetical protein
MIRIIFITKIKYIKFILGDVVSREKKKKKESPENLN